jgi:quinol monooxygenase YgiN
MWMTVFVTLELALKPEIAEGFLGQLRDILAETSGKPGFIAIDVHRQEDAPERLMVFEQWQSADAYRTYFKWRMETGFMEALKPILVEEPRLRIWQAPEISITAR